jgi:hypothetical protein
MLGETYDIISAKNRQRYLFKSIGPKGTILKAVLFQPVGKGRFNLAFGDLKSGDIDDEIVSNNNDFVKVLATVAKCAYDFIEHNPEAILEIVPVDKRRNVLYNAIFKRHHPAILENFKILARRNGEFELYDPEKEFDKFELYHKF